MRPLEHIVDTELIKECLHMSNHILKFKHDLRAHELATKLEEILNEGFLTKAKICIEWDTLDVQYVRPDLTENEAMDVLLYAKEHHDKTIGISFDLINNHCTTLFPRKK